MIRYKTYCNTHNESLLLNAVYFCHLTPKYYRLCHLMLPTHHSHSRNDRTKKISCNFLAPFSTTCQNKLTLWQNSKP